MSVPVNADAASFIPYAPIVEVRVDREEINSLAAREVSRRGLLQGAGAVGVGALGLAMSDPVYAATTGYDLATGVNPAEYQAPSGLAKTSPAKDSALGWINEKQGQLVRLNDRIWEFAELSLREWESSFSTAESVMTTQVPAVRSTGAARCATLAHRPQRSE
jgi:hypothetical protein